MFTRAISASSALLGLLLACTTALTDELNVWVVPSLQRVGLNGPAGSGSVAVLQAARGEFESFQIAVKAPASAGLTNVSVSVSDLSGPDGEMISNSNATLYREQYVHVGTGSPDWGGANRPLGAGWYPDALIPFVDPQTGRPLTGAALTAVPSNVAPGQNQPFWVDIFVPRTAPAGQYEGAFTVTCDQGSFTGQITLGVWDFTLPVSPSLKSSFLIWSASGIPTIQELLRNKLNPSKAPPSAQASLIDSFGLAATDLGFWSGADISNCVMSAAPSVSSLKKSLAAEDPQLFLYNYTADEIGSCPSLVSTLKQWARNLHAAGVNNLVTMAPSAQLLDDGSGAGRSAVDIWVVLPVVYDQNVQSIAAAQSKGNEIWSYNALVQDAYSPKWEIDFDPINFRIQPGFLSQSLKLTGLLYWRVDLWSASPWTEVNTSGFSRYAGEGMLVYPGATVGIQGVAPSMRLKWLRDGVEDYEYIELLKKAGRGPWALQIAAQAGTDWSHWTRDGNVLEAARKQLGDTLDHISTLRRRGLIPLPGTTPNR